MRKLASLYSQKKIILEGNQRHALDLSIEKGASSWLNTQSLITLIYRTLISATV